jgi:hypothetical protein
VGPFPGAARLIRFETGTRAVTNFGGPLYYEPKRLPFRSLRDYFNGRTPSSLQEVSKIREKVKNYAVSPPERRPNSIILKGKYRSWMRLPPDLIL